MAADPFDVDAAVIAAVKNVAALMALCPAGVYYAVAPQGVQSFVIVDRLAHVDDRNMYADAASETFLFLVKAVIPGSASNVARAAAKEIRSRLLGGALELVDYALMAPVDEVESLRIVEVDDANPDRRVQHAGGHYEVTVQRLR
jgi:hypothetical protein